MDAIIYTSNTGTTKEYAMMLGDKIKLPVYSLEEAGTKVSAGKNIIYLGWIMASEVKGYRKAAAKYHVRAVCGVCMGATGSQIKEVREKNAIPADIEVFTLQGGFDINKLHGVYKMMMTVMRKTAGKGLAEKKDRTTEEDQMLDMMMNGRSFVREENMKAVLEWYQAR